MFPAWIDPGDSARFAYVVVPDEEYTLQSAHDKPVSLSTINNLISASDLKSLEPRTSFKNELPSAEKALAAMEGMAIEIWDELKNERMLEMGDLSDRVRMMIDSIERNPYAYTWLCSVKDYQSLTHRHALNVSGLLTVFGRQLELGRKDLQLLALGGLCLDVGNFKLPEGLLNKKTRLTDDEWETMKTHVRHSMQLLKQLTDADEKMLWMVATHHERYDGSGYLAGVSGDHIPLFGQMAGIVDTYLASTEPKPYATAMTSDDCIETLFRQRDHHFKSSLVDQFIHAIGVHPTGSLVELSSGEIALVVAQNTLERLRPRVALILDAHKAPYQDYPLVNLATQTHTSDGKSLDIIKGLRMGQYPIALQDILGSVKSHVDVEDLRTDKDNEEQREQKEAEVIVSGKKARQARTRKEDFAQYYAPATSAKPSKTSRFIRAVAAIAGGLMIGGYVVYQQGQLEHMAKQLEESRQMAANKAEEARLLAEAEAERNAIAELKAEEARLLAETEARRKEVETELKAALEAKRQVELETERKAALEARRQAELEAERKTAVEAKRRAALEAARKAAAEAKRQAALEVKPGNVFRDRLKDGGEGPEMVVVPTGSFRMGSLQEGGEADEKPVRTVRFDKPFAMGRYEVTFDEYDRFARASGRKLPDDKGWGRGRNPVINVSWKDAIAYIYWLSEQTGQSYRLPTEAEWEYAARAGSEYKYAWGNDIDTNRANCNGCRSRWDGKQTAPVGSFQPNRFALHDTAGNVWEWVEDCWRPNYNGNPTDTSAWLKVSGGNCGRRMRRGGSWNDDPSYVRLANRGRGAPNYRNFNLGFRVARDIK
jgi:formylglycine-generating enzyme required for sulfatase activity/HD-GYP domain-containing protein (c-di-GMP phosphodiesterase class II)